jgi:AbrB family looped-hinge helix DNA binding protein
MLESKSRNLTKLSSKGQVVIPKEIREKLNLREGTPLTIEATDTGLVVIKEIKSPIDDEDLKALKELNEAWGRIERGEYRKAKVDDFLKELEEW